jgi:hypothetical protein
MGGLLMGQKIRGLVGQRMSGRRGRVTAPVYSFPAGAHAFKSSASGFYRIAMWGAGGGGSISTGGNGAGASGAYVEAIRWIAKGQVIALVVAPGTAMGGNGAASTVTLPGGEVLSAGGGNASAGAGGTAVAGPLDTALNGTQGAPEGVNGSPGAGNNPGLGGTGSGNGGGAGAPGNGNFKGGAGAMGGGGGLGPGCPGGGGATQSSVGLNQTGAGGLIVVQQIRIDQ